MSADESRVRAWLDEHWTVPSRILDARLPSPESPNALRDALTSMQRGAQQLQLVPVASLIDAIVAALDAGETTSGPIEDAVEGLEDTLICLDIGDPIDQPRLETLTAALGSRAPAQPAASPAATSPAPPVTPTVAASAPPAAPMDEPLVWGPWEPAYPDMIGDYFEEMQTHLDNLQDGLVRLASGEQDADLVNSLFRSSHSIKGQSAQMNAQPPSKIAHQLEDVLAAVREDKLTIGPVQVQALLGVVDVLAEMISQLRDEGSVAVVVAHHTRAMARLIAGEPLETPSGTPQVTQPSAPTPQQAPQKQATASQPTPIEHQTTGSSAPQPSARQQTNQDAPAQPSKQPTAPKKPPAKGGKRAQAQYLRVDFNKIDKTLGRIGDLFLNKLQLRDLVASVEEVQLEITRLRNILMRSSREADDTLKLSGDDATELQDLLTRLEERLDGTSEQMTEVVGDADMISSDLRDQVMEMRLVPIDTVLGRLGRVLFDAIQRENRGNGPTYKQAKLEVTGSDTELDKRLATMLEVPLVHIVRNAVAHGIEPSEERQRAGKPAQGVVKVDAFQQTGRVFLRVRDDGRGIDPDVIAGVAVAKGIVTSEQVEGMSEQERLGLIFRPGFTTAEKADDLKGRGVGLDEVMEKIRAVKGEVLVESVVGSGSTVTLSLPLTLAIATVVVGEVAGETLAIPMSAVERVIDVDERRVESMGAAEVFTLEGKTLPLVRLDELLGMTRPAAQRPDVCHGVLVEAAGQRVALAMDRTRGQREVVIKGFGSLIAQGPMMSGATIFGDKCVLVLSPHDVVQEVTRAGAAMRTGATNATGSAGGAGRARTALVVDDDSLARVALRRIFEQAGLVVQEAADGIEGLEAAQSARFDIISTDVVMPRMDGYELTRQLRGLPAYEATPIVMISSKGEDVDKKAGFDVGVDHYVTKPFDRGEMIRLVQEVMR